MGRSDREGGAGKDGEMDLSREGRASNMMGERTRQHRGQGSF